MTVILSISTYELSVIVINQDSSIVVKPIDLFLVVWHISVKEIPITMGMPFDFQMANFMQYNIVYPVFWRFDEMHIEIN
jgi:hypothetical protein